MKKNELMYASPEVRIRNLSVEAPIAQSDIGNTEPVVDDPEEHKWD